MRLLVLSDTHFEFHKDHGKSFVNWIWEENKKDPPDTIILAGDISDIDRLRASIKMFAERFEAIIVFVIGNHELYGTTPQNALKKAWRIEEDIEGVHWLEMYPYDGTMSICFHDKNKLKEVNITGGTLWFPVPDDTARKDWINDFQCIHDFEPWVYEHHTITVRNLARHITQDGIVVTHHGPSLKSIHPKYNGSPINQFFTSDLEWLIESKKPSLWIQGHAHESLDYMIGKTRVICNPFGYVRESENKNFNPSLIIEV